MTGDAIVHNANEIALKFQSFPREQAIEGIREHIKRFWERGSRDRLIAWVARGGEGLSELVVEAVKQMPMAS